MSNADVFQSNAWGGDSAMDSMRSSIGSGQSLWCNVICRCENGGMALEWTNSYLKDSLAVFRHYKSLAERAMAQLTDQQLLVAIDEESNSIAVIVKHMAGNMRSRFTDFLTTDGEKPDRQRDQEFVDPPATRQAMIASWEAGWASVFAALESLSEDDLGKTITIRSESHSVMQAINRQVAHYSYHCGQIVLLAKHLNHPTWKPLTVARGESEEFNRQVLGGRASQVESRCDAVG
jgi:uncharacterized damage-inducible protein DinB